MKTCRIFPPSPPNKCEYLHILINRLKRSAERCVGFELSCIYIYYISIKCHCLVQCRSRVANRCCRHMEYNIAGLQRPIRNAITHRHSKFSSANQTSYTSGILPRLQTSALCAGNLTLAGINTKPGG